MPNSTSVDVICPFYRSHSEKCISCEGLIQSTTNTTRFASEACRSAYQTETCNHYEYANTCPLAEKLSAIYETGGR